MVLVVDPKLSLLVVADVEDAWYWHDSLIWLGLVESTTTGIEETDSLEPRYWSSRVVSLTSSTLMSWMVAATTSDNVVVGIRIKHWRSS